MCLKRTNEILKKSNLDVFYMWEMYILSLCDKQKLPTKDEDFQSCGNQKNHVAIVLLLNN